MDVKRAAELYAQGWTLSQIGHVMNVWNPANKTTIEARSTRAGVGRFSYANGPRHNIFEIWRLGNLHGDPR